MRHRNMHIHTYKATRTLSLSPLGFRFRLRCQVTNTTTIVRCGSYPLEERGPVTYVGLKARLKGSSGYSRWLGWLHFGVDQQVHWTLLIISITGLPGPDSIITYGRHTAGIFGLFNKQTLPHITFSADTHRRLRVACLQFGVTSLWLCCFHGNHS